MIDTRMTLMTPALGYYTVTHDENTGSDAPTHKINQRVVARERHLADLGAWTLGALGTGGATQRSYWMLMAYSAADVLACAVRPDQRAGAWQALVSIHAEIERRWPSESDDGEDATMGGIEIAGGE